MFLKSVKVKRENFTNERKDEVKMKKILCVCVSVLMSISVAAGAVQCEEASLKILSQKGIAEGYSDGELHGEDNLTRAQFANMLWRAFPVAVTEAENIFSDLERNHWAYQNIQNVVNAGWLSGYGNGNFGPDDNITYEQALTVVCRIVGEARVGSYPQSYISASIDCGLADGVNGLIGEEITREQAARIILNAMEYIEENKVSPAATSKTSSGDNRAYGYMSVSSGGSGGGGGGGRPAAAATADSYGGYAGEYVFSDYSTEEYTSNEENMFKDVLTSPLSTFSIDTDTASYSNMRRFILNNQKIPEGSIRTEELINYFDFKGPGVNQGDVFGVKTELGICPWNSENKLAMITVKGEEFTEYAPSNLVFLIDTSGSMYSYNKLPFVKKSLSMLLDKLGENDTVSIVTYASGTRIALEPTPATEKEKILGVIDSLRAGGGTAGASGINLAYDMAEKAKIDGNNRIILCTDGDFNIGISSTGDLEKLIEEKRKTGIYLSVLGFGMGNYKDNRMETLADKGNGNYAYIDNLREAKKVFVDDMSKTIYAIAKDVKIQVEFNPSAVKSYRLVGYENRILNNEDFENDKKDAGELGAGSNVTVFYEIVPADGTEKTELKYQDITPKASDELMTVKVRYKPINSDESVLKEFPVKNILTESLSEDFSFACAVAQLGMILNDSEYKGTSTLDSVIALAREGKGEDYFGLRSEFIQLIDLYRYNNQ